MIWLLLINVVSIRTAEKVAIKKAYQQNWNYPLVKIIEAYDFKNEPSAYFFVFGEENTKDYINVNRKTDKWGKNQFLTVVVSAQEYNQPILEVSKSLPALLVNFDKAKEKVKEISGGDVYFEKYIYNGHIDHWILFKDKFQRKWYINAYNLKIMTQEDVYEIIYEEIKNMTTLSPHAGWNLIDEINFLAQDSGYVDSVPFCYWSYGCSPTASAMIMWYWDVRGFGKLVDFYFDRYDPPEGDYDKNLPNVQRELAIEMHTDTMIGATNPFYIAGGQCGVTQNNGYSDFSCPSYPPAGFSENWYWDIIVEEIDSGRPTHWAVLNYWYNQPGHSVCAVGYVVDDAGDSLVIVHNTWNNIEEQWALHTTHAGGTSRSAVYPVKPGTPNPNNIFITEFPKGPFIPNIEYPIYWELTGSDIKKLALKFVESEKPENVTDITTFDNPSQGMDWWKTSLKEKEGRFELDALSSYNALLAADCIFEKVEIVDTPEKGSFNILAHINWNKFQRSITLGNYLVGISPSGIYTFDISDKSRPKKIDYFEYSCSPAVTYNKGYLFIGNISKKIGIFTLDNGKLNLVKELECKGKPLDIIPGGNFLFSAEQTKGLVIYDISSIQDVKEISFVEFPQIYGACKKGNKVYVALKRNGVGIVDVSDPSNPVKESFTIEDYTILHIVPYDNLLYMAAGNDGWLIVDENTHQVIKQISLDEGTASRIRVTSNNYILLSAKTGGLWVYKISSPQDPTFVTKFKGFASAEEGIDIRSNIVTLSDGNDGIYLLETPFQVSEVKEVITEELEIKKSLSNVIHFNVGEPFSIKLKLYSADGRLVRYLNKEFDRGSHSLAVGRNLPKGVYFIRISLNTLITYRRVEKTYKIVSCY